MGTRETDQPPLWIATSDLPTSPGHPSRVWAAIGAPQYSRRQGPRTVKKPSCLNPECSFHGNVESRCIIRYGFYRTTAGKRRRYRCVGCGQTFSTTKGTPYYRLQHRRTTFDTVVTLRVEGVNISAIGRVERLAWNTVARWLERAALVCRRFSDGRTTGFVATELQADEIRSFTGGKTRPTWVFAVLPSSSVGEESLSPNHPDTSSRF